MDNLGQASKLLDQALEGMKRPMPKVAQIGAALRLGAVVALVLVDIAISLRELNGYEEEANGSNQD